MSKPDINRFSPIRQFTRPERGRSMWTLRDAGIARQSASVWGSAIRTSVASTSVQGVMLLDHSQSSSTPAARRR